MILVFGGEGFPVVLRMLTLVDREEISRGLAESLEYREIAAVISRDPSVMSREVACHGGRGGYRAVDADRVAVTGRSRPKVMAVDRSPEIRSVVLDLLRLGWSPGSIAGRLARERGDGDPDGVSHEAIYQWVYAQPVATLAWELIALRTGRTARRGPRPAPAPRIREPRYLDEHPAEVQGRAVAGQWEGDLVVGKGGKSAVATLVERTSRFLIMVPLHGRDSLTVSEAIIAAVGSLPATTKRSLTWDCGSEMALHKDITATGLPVFFAHPHSPWECGSNKNLNRIVREYLPKGIEITHDPTYLAAIAAEINDRPRKIHDWRKPSEVFIELLEADASTPEPARVARRIPRLRSGSSRRADQQGRYCGAPQLAGAPPRHRLTIPFGSNRWRDGWRVRPAPCMVSSSQKPNSKRTSKRVFRGVILSIDDGSRRITRDLFDLVPVDFAATRTTSHRPAQRIPAGSNVRLGSPTGTAKSESARAGAVSDRHVRRSPAR